MGLDLKDDVLSARRLGTAKKEARAANVPHLVDSGIAVEIQALVHLPTTAFRNGSPTSSTLLINILSAQRTWLALASPSIVLHQRSGRLMRFFVSSRHLPITCSRFYPSVTSL